MRSENQKETHDVRQRATLKCAAVLVLAFAFQQSVWAQDDTTAASLNAGAAASAEPQTATGSVPRLIKFSGVVMESVGKPAAGAVALTFTLYNAQEEGAALWRETQSAQLDSQGHYTVLLGAESAAGLPLDLFASGSALWLGVQPQLPGAGEQPRVLLVAVPYALKAADADTLGGKPASAYALSPDQATSSIGRAASGKLAVAASQGAHVSHAGQPAETSGTHQNPGSASGVGGSGTLNFIPIWTGSHTIGNSILFQTGGDVGVGTSTPGARVDAASPGIAVRGTSSGTSGTGLFGNATATSGSTNGVYGQSASPSGTGVFGNATSNSGNGTGVYGQTSSPGAAGVVGVANVGGAGLVPTGVYGTSSDPNGNGVGGNASATSGSATGVGGSSASSTGSGVAGFDTASSGGTGVTGVATATSGYANGVYGQSASADGAGVFGNNTATGSGVFGQISGTFGAGVSGYAWGSSGYNNGVYAQSSSTQGTGVNGNAVATSGSPTGVVGTSAGGNGGIGVWGSNVSTSGTGVGVRGDIEASAANGTAGLFINWPGQGLVLEGHAGANYDQVFTVDASGNLDISGNLTVAGSKSARVKLQDGREVALYAVESPENWFEDFGTAQLQGGAAEVSLEPGFLQTVDTAADYHVFLTPKGDCHGLYVASTTPAGFEVRELGGGTSSIAFDYRIVARRRGFEKVRLQEVHLPEVSAEMKSRLTKLRAVRPVAVPVHPRITIPAVQQAGQQTH